MPDQRSIPLVVHVVVSLDVGGAERMVVDSVNTRNKRHSASTTVVCLDVPGKLAGEINRSELFCADADRSGFPWDVSAVKKLKAIVSSNVNSGLMFQVSGFALTILHAHNMAAWQYAVLASIGTGNKVVYTQHGINIHNLGFKNRFRSIVLSWFTDRIVAVSENAAEAVVKNQSIPRCRIRIVRNGVDTELFKDIAPHKEENRTRFKSNLDIPESSFVVGSVGRFDHVKGYDVFISSFAALAGAAKRHEHALSSPMLLLVGDGPERGNLEDLARRLGVFRQVVFAGYQNEIKKYLGAMDLFVLPSRSEGISLSLLEACACGLPVVVTSAGGNTEVIQDGESGLVVPPDDEDALRVSIEKLWSDQGLGRRLADAAQKRVSECFSINRTIDEYEKIYTEVIVGKSVE